MSQIYGSTEMLTRKSPSQPIKSLQFDLFTNFLGDSAELSNTIELWDCIPKFSISSRRQSRLRSSTGRLPVHEHSFVYAARVNGTRREHSCRVSIQPASIKVGKDYVDYYPAANEELVEEVLRKIFTDQQYGIHSPSQGESWVKFSVQMIRRELANRGKTRSIAEIKRSIDILAKTHLSLFVDDGDDPVYSASILSDVTRVTRKKYLEDTSSSWIARLPAIISKSVNELTYRQFNYGVLMSLDSQLARWLHKRLSHNYINASHAAPYSVLYRTLQRDSGFLAHPRTNDAVRALEEAFNNLVRNEVLQGWQRLEERRKGTTLLDIKYRLLPHSRFIADIKAANARLKHARPKLRT